MDTIAKSEEGKLDFPTFIKKYFDWYEIDRSNQKVLEDLSLWANRDEKFNNPQLGWHLDKSLFIHGNPGTGKDELFRMINKYLKYLKSNYVFDHKIVWNFANEFSHKETGGYRVFDTEGKQNRYYEELALTDESTNYPTREVVNYFGNKILIGAELIHITHNAFKNRGYQAHFSSNVPKEQLPGIYGDRAFSRLEYMCNFIKYIGRDRRKGAIPIIINNQNQPAGPPPPAELDPQIEQENKNIIERSYTYYLESGELAPDSHFFYDALNGFGVQVGTEQELRTYMDDIVGHYAEGIGDSKKSKEERERSKRAFAWREARVLAIELFYQKLKAAGAQSIFGERNVNTESVLKINDGKQ